MFNSLTVYNCEMNGFLNKIFIQHSFVFALSGKNDDDSEPILIGQSSHSKRNRVPIKLLKALRDASKVCFWEAKGAVKMLNGIFLDLLFFASLLIPVLTKLVHLRS